MKSMIRLVTAAAVIFAVTALRPAHNDGLIPNRGGEALEINPSEIFGA
jgi:hypothetical protein